MVSGFGEILDTLARAINGFGSGHVFRDYSDKGKRARDEKAWREKHGTNWDELK